VGPYPYKTIKAVLGDMNAGGGMEYPTITLIAKTAVGNLKTVIVHEAGHNWFYGMLGSNERDHAWMDEGMNTFYEQKTIEATRKIPHGENRS
jgi:aminopeptidase N